MNSYNIIVISRKDADTCTKLSNDLKELFGQDGEITMLPSLIVKVKGEGDHLLLSERQKNATANNDITLPTKNLVIVIPKCKYLATLFLQARDHVNNDFDLLGIDTDKIDNQFVYSGLSSILSVKVVYKKVI